MTARAFFMNVYCVVWYIGLVGLDFYSGYVLTMATNGSEVHRINVGRERAPEHYVVTRILITIPRTTR